MDADYPLSFVKALIQITETWREKSLSQRKPDGTKERAADGRSLLFYAEGHHRSRI